MRRVLLGLGLGALPLWLAVAPMLAQAPKADCPVDMAATPASSAPSPDYVRMSGNPYRFLY